MNGMTHNIIEEKYMILKVNRRIKEPVGVFGE
ncbi:MAG: hypothetical protein PWQ20_210 [Thermotogaceae bacterium]|jgi:hypothetical protein|nr:hypothetical protein [Thermotogaceae bacterium]MDN5337140.1 hypothetical protein [Thermotogaceae bacterium]